jgi:hypothetical protein
MAGHISAVGCGAHSRDALRAPCEHGDGTSTPFAGADRAGREVLSGITPCTAFPRT